MSRRPWTIGKYPWLALIMVLSICGVGAWRFFSVRADRPAYLLGTVDRGDIAIQVAAAGTLSAVTTVQVGSQVSGNIAELYADYNSEVKRGQLLARLDPQIFETQVRQSEASVRTAEMTLDSDLAGTANAKANLEKAKVDVVDKQRKFTRQKELFDNGLITRDDFDSAQANLQAAAAAQSAAEAQLQSAEASYKADEARLEQARASLQTARVNLEHTMIYSPISGTVISRSVDRGQTVAASMSAPTLFTIGEDLTKMQIITNIDEADVGRIKTGMPATFTVDAYPEEVFGGTISQIRLAATTVQNVVTYSAVFSVDNSQQRLKPGMTANVKILVEEVTDVLKIPNSALRFKPALTEKERRDSQSGVKAPNGSSGPGSSGAPGLGQKGQNGGRRVSVWVLASDRSLRPVVVQAGLSDGLSTQLLSGSLKEGDKIVTGVESDSKRTAASSTTAQPQKSSGAPPPPPPM
jgi:HlyD family secretion protein